MLSRRRGELAAVALPIAVTDGESDRLVALFAGRSDELSMVADCPVGLCAEELDRLGDAPRSTAIAERLMSSPGLPSKPVHGLDFASNACYLGWKSLTGDKDRLPRETTRRSSCANCSEVFDCRRRIGHERYCGEKERNVRLGDATAETFLHLDAIYYNLINLEACNTVEWKIAEGNGGH